LYERKASRKKEGGKEGRERKGKRETKPVRNNTQKHTAQEQHRPPNGPFLLASESYFSMIEMMEERLLLLLLL
jgi:hypothetical protein